MRLRLYYLLSLLLAICCCAARGQELPMRHFTTDNGLPSNTIYDIYRDSKGYLWIGTDKGIARYDGIQFETFTTFNGLADNEIFFFQEDWAGRLWMATFNGQLCYYKDGVFHTRANTPFLRLPFKAPFISVIYPEADSSLTINFANCAKFVNITKNDQMTVHDVFSQHNIDVFRKYDYDTARATHFFFQIITLRKYGKGFEMISWYNRSYLDPNCNIYKVVKDTTQDTLNYQFSQNGRYYNSIRYLFDNDLKLIRVLDKSRYQMDEYYFEHFKRIYRDEKHLIIAPRMGLYIDDTLTIGKDQSFSAISRDIAGNYWLGTSKNGIYTVNQAFYSVATFKQVFSGNVNYSHAFKGSIYFTTEDNDLYELKNGKAVLIYRYPNKYNKDKAIYPSYFIAPDNTYYSFYNNEIVIIDDIKKKHPRAFICKNTTYVNAVKGAFTVNGKMYGYESARILKFDMPAIIRSKQMTDHKHISVLNNIYNHRIFGLRTDDNGQTWYSTIDNMYKIKNDTCEPQQQFHRSAFKAFDFAGSYMIGTSHNNKLFICNNINSNNVIADSLELNNCIWDKFYRLDSTHLLISTNNLYRVVTVYPSSGSPKFSIQTIEDPLIPVQASSICSDGKICYFFKNGDVITYTIDALLQQATPPRLYFTTLSTGHKNYILNNSLQLYYYNSRNISISFSRLSFYGTTVSCQYSISKNGKDNWTDIDGDKINLVNTGYGTYTVKIRAKTLSSDYSAPAVLTLQIERPYWATWWFITLCICGLAVAVVLIIRRRTAVILGRQEKEHDTQVRFMRSEYKALNALMNPHFIFNTLNNVQSLVNGDNKKAANEYLRIFADLVRQNMHNVSKELIPLQKELDLVKNYLLLEKLRFEDKLTYSIDIDESIETYDVMISPLLIQPLVENSIKHGILPMVHQQGIIQISIQERDKVLYIHIKDNGVGLKRIKTEAGALHESFGLENIRKRMEQLSIIQNKQITFDIKETDDQNGRKWTVASITMPID